MRQSGSFVHLHYLFSEWLLDVQHNLAQLVLLERTVECGMAMLAHGCLVAVHVV